MNFYRVENKKGKGPYAVLSQSEWVDCIHDEETGHPAPRDDSKLWDKLNDLGITSQWDIPCSYRFGFSSLKSFKAWFSKSELKQLKEYGFCLKVFKVKPGTVLKGKYQAMIKKDHL